MMRALLVLAVGVFVAPVFPLAVPMEEPIGPIDGDTIESMGAKILTLKSEMEELVRSFKTLQVIAENPSLLADLKNYNNKSDVLVRHRRDDGASLDPTPGSGMDGGQQPAAPVATNPILGPYSYPMFSGQCFLCPAGKEGPRGPTGPSGRAGRDGRDGRDAVYIPDEDQSHDVTVTTQPPANPPPPSQNENKEGAVYVRWGKSDCANGSELVYAGTMAGSAFTHIGSGSNYLCMPSVPVYDEYVGGTQSGRGSVWSAEYETWDAPARLADSSINQHTPTCAVCMAPEGYTSKVMVPGRNDCPSNDWRLEYAGYLMTSDNEQKRAEFVCVDREMEAEPGSGSSQDGAVLYMVETECLAGAGLPCDPYKDGYELTCAVCTI